MRPRERERMAIGYFGRGRHCRYCVLLRGGFVRRLHWAEGEEAGSDNAVVEETLWLTRDVIVRK